MSTTCKQAITRIKRCVIFMRTGLQIVIEVVKGSYRPSSSVSLEDGIYDKHWYNQVYHHPVSCVLLLYIHGNTYIQLYTLPMCRYAQQHSTTPGVYKPVLTRSAIIGGRRAPPWPISTLGGSGPQTPPSVHKPNLCPYKPTIVHILNPGWPTSTVCASCPQLHPCLHPYLMSTKAYSCPQTPLNVHKTTMCPARSCIQTPPSVHSANPSQMPTATCSSCHQRLL